MGAKNDVDGRTANEIQACNIFDLIGSSEPVKVWILRCDLEQSLQAERSNAQNPSPGHRPAFMPKRHRNASG
ncbi:MULTISPECIES: hypothetical protein [unclassified Bradyrhizobium]|uniref:hypothetical protein n=1 Tax=unclassified Bradyrhizobium TaxID=2631580 RepID=UPI0028E56BFF|nr:MULTISPECIES: hypothetical protein [unclassified Bradyrhizobium]